MSYELSDKGSSEILEAIKRNTRKEAEKLAEAIIKRLTWQSEQMTFREQQRIERIKHRRRK